MPPNRSAVLMETKIMAHEFAGKVALVTGAASGIGEACALALAEGGARLVLADVDIKGLERVVATITASGGRAVSQSTDVADPAAMDAVVALATRTYGGLHLAINNAGIGGPAAKVGDYPLDGWARVIAVNLDSVFYGLRYEIPAIIASGGGAIVNMASILGSVGFANAPAYVAAKHGVVGLTKAAAIDHAKDGVRINAVGPGFIDTPLLSKNLDASALAGIAALHPVGRLGRSEEVAALTLFLLSDAASFITGSYHLVDGGYVAQ
jgi:NAD(P)-dependent dehydrogenase (short-subunit alcohol dehydrogenase family)